MKEFCALRPKAYTYKLDDDTEMKKANGTKKCLVKTEITFKNYTDALFNDKITIRSQQRFRSALTNNHDKRIQIFDRITTYSYGTNAFKVCENETR